MAYKLSIERYGKMNNVELEVLPLTLFVGDNNSGKSYLLSLIWAILSGEQNEIITSGLHEILKDNYSALYLQVLNLVKSKDSNIFTEKIVIDEAELEKIINDLFAQNKDALVKSIFNFEGMSIGKIAISITNKRKITIQRANTNGVRQEIRAYWDSEKSGKRIVYADKSAVYMNAVDAVFRAIISYILCSSNEHNTCYLPAARTGFMLAKNTINEFGRKKAFDFLDVDIEEIEDTSPFPKTIIHFLNCIDNINTSQKREKYANLVEWITLNMSKGDVDCLESNSGNVAYTPIGENLNIPLRATSGVVTELTPLILLLKYRKELRSLCYEEPEMCLHPQLQLQMARLLIRMVNAGISIAATTHSDIIIQHINNMCELNKLAENEEALKKLDLSKEDLIDSKSVAVYQLADRGASTEVERILPKNGKFEVSSFMRALEKILYQTMDIADIVESGDT